MKPCIKFNQILVAAAFGNGGDAIVADPEKPAPKALRRARTRVEPIERRFEGASDKAHALSSVTPPVTRPYGLRRNQETALLHMARNGAAA